MSNDYKIVGTAGHIDHGKSALVRALTGTDPDRLQEERDRGITIDLGFAHLELDGGTRVGFVDVPGHERFVKNMLAGIGGIDAVLFVVAADESIMPQTREHLAICKLLGVDSGVVAITKCDLVDEELAELVELEVRELLAGSQLADVPIVRTSAETRAGLTSLTTTLGAILESGRGRPQRKLVRLPVDRVFTVRGFGTVVTGTLLSGNITAGDKLELLPSGEAVTVRGVQVYGETVEAAVAGQRTAVNLQGVDMQAVSRGDLLMTPGSIAKTFMLDARVDMLDGHPLEHLQRVRFHHGAAEILCRVAILDRDEVPAGGTGLAQLRLETPYACVPGDRFVIRRYSPMITIGGGVVVDNLPKKHRRRDPEAVALLTRLAESTPAARLEALVDDAGPAGIGELPLRRRLFLTRAELKDLAEPLREQGRIVFAQRDPLLLVSAGDVDELASAAIAEVRAYHAAHPLEPGIAKSGLTAALPRGLSETVVDALIQRLEKTGKVRLSGTAIALAGHAVVLDADQEAAREALLRLYATGGWSPPPLTEALETLDVAEDQAKAVFHLLMREGKLTRLRDDLVFETGRLQELADAVRSRYAPGEGFGVADFKDLAGVSRKHAIPLLEYLDQRRVTRRAGDQRIRV